MKITIVLFTLLLTVTLSGTGSIRAVAGDGSLLLAAAKKQRFSGTVELYVTSWCGYCRKAINYLKDHDIPYVAYDIEKDNAALERYQELGGRGVPLIIVGPNRMYGYSQEALEHYLETTK